MSDKIRSRFDNGINDTSSGDWNDDLRGLDPIKTIRFWEDFCGPNSYPVAASGLAAASNGTWSITVTEGGGGDASSTYGGINGGILILTTDAGDNDLIFSQVQGTAFQPALNKKLFFKVRFLITDANADADSIANTEFYFGLMKTNTDPFSAPLGAGIGDGMMFMKDDATQDVAFYVQKDDTTGQLATPAVTTIDVATYTELAFSFDGVRYVRLYKDDVYLQTIDLTATLSAYLPDQTIGVAFGIKNGEAVAKTLIVDYLFCAMER